MKYLELLPSEAKSLKQSLTAVVVSDSTSEIIDLSYNKIPLIAQDRYDLLFSHDLLDGEALLLSNISDFLVINNAFYHVKPFRKINFDLKGKTLQIGSPIIKSHFLVSNEVVTLFTSSELIDAIYPLPFRDKSFDNVVISEILDYDIVKESYRVLKDNGRGYIIVNFKKANPIDAIKVFSIRYTISYVTEKEGYWIIEGKKELK